MEYVSTRGGGSTPGTPSRFTDILLGGLMPDGGLAMPVAYPRLSATDLAAMRRMNYRELAFSLLSLFADDEAAYEVIRSEVTAERVAAHFGDLGCDVGHLGDHARIDDDDHGDHAGDTEPVQDRDLPAGCELDYPLRSRGIRACQ